jgi:hopene-associated glycosyltransferase HpnB
LQLQRAPVVKEPIRIAAIVPARNEADVIHLTLISLQRQDTVELRVYLVDDNSSDNTTEVARSASSTSEKLIVISGRPLPEGWSGKVWAMQQGVEAARSFNPDYFLFTDADIEHASENVAHLVAIAREGNYDLASFMVKLHCQAVPEKLLIPAFVFFFFKLYPPSWIADRRTSTAGAAGGCILMRTTALDRAGGLESIRGEIIDDCSLAREVKRSGSNVWLGLTEGAQSVRPYRGFQEIGHMISRTAFNQLDHSILALIGSVLGLLVIYIVPIASLFSSSQTAMLLGAIAFAMMMTAYAPMVRFYRLNPLWTLTLPFAAIFYLGATIQSAIYYWAGRGGQWKGRVQDRAGVTRAN